ncbi:MAG: peptide chain release factor 2 [Rickettsiaceae bacterium]|nr:peptide chain release factor 2 [Rickettsiaceae bacterium]
MRAELENLKNKIEDSLALIKRSLDPDGTRKKLDELQKLSLDPNLWNDQKKASGALKEKRLLEKTLESYDYIYNGLLENVELAQMAEEENDEEVISQVQLELIKIQVISAKLETECLFSGEADGNNCFLEINAGAGGTESHDWASIMMRMYLRFGERMGFNTEIINIISGEEAGIKSCCIKFKGDMAYGWLKSESGVHRLVRISPFNAAGKRMTSFASCWVYPEVDESIDIVIEEKDLRIDTYRSSGAGGQHVNTTDSAVRITHLPTNIAVQCQNDRSQHRNKAEAMQMLKARLFELELQKKNEEVNKQNAAKTDNGWGHQIRSYVLQPYQMVKDLRTSYETSDAAGVLDGNLEKFVSSALAANVNKRS